MWNQIGEINSYDYLMDLFHRTTAETIVEKTMEVDIHSYLPYDLLVKVDIASMANSLEVRSPFLDHKLMEYVATIPEQSKLRGMTNKYILKKAFMNKIPREIIKRKKRGFGVPIGKWFKNELKDFAYDILLNREGITNECFQLKEIEELLHQHSSGKFDHGYRIWSLLILELWYREFIKN
jgi:asparagine synthase (glutamine-hydrolysing)